MRLKIWTSATVKDAEDHPELAALLRDSGDEAGIERLITLTIEAYDWNCPQHITPRFTEEEILEGVCRFAPDGIESCEARD